MGKGLACLLPNTKIDVSEVTYVKFLLPETEGGGFSGFKRAGLSIEQCVVLCISTSGTS
jgi:hypothetical protein